jgi:MarR family transcriptional regulator, organic hydroperoxide resistance regulator
MNVPSTTQSENKTFLAVWGSTLAPRSIGYRFKLLTQLMSRHFQEALEPHGLTVFHWVVLCCLWEEDGLATSVICERLQQVGGTLTGVLDRMEERGLIRRVRDRNDRRIWRIYLSDEGDGLRYILPPIAHKVTDEVLAGITETERALLSRIIDQAIQNLS